MKKRATKAKVKSAIRAIRENRLDKVEQILDSCPEVVHVQHPTKHITVSDCRPPDSDNQLFGIIAEAEKRCLTNKTALGSSSSKDRGGIL